MVLDYYLTMELISLLWFNSITRVDADALLYS